MNTRRLLIATALLVGFFQSASADVWRWVDANGNTHFVDTMRPIYTWRDDFGKVFFSDKPDHVNAVSVQLIWHSSGTLGQAKQEDESSGSTELRPGETEAERAERKAAEAYYCKRATEIYDSYVNAPRLYKTGKDGEPEYLSEKDAAKAIAETKSKVDELCN